MSADRATIWRRRGVLMLVVGLVVAIPLTLALRSDDDSGDSAAPAAIELPTVGDTEVDRDLGVRFGLPEGWRSDREDDVLTLRSGAGDVRVAVSAPGPAEDADLLHEEVLQGLRAQYGDVRVLARRKRSRVGGLRGRETALAARAPGSGKQAEKRPAAERQLRILLSTAPGDKRAYVVVVFTRAGEAGGSVLEAQELLNELRFVS